MQLSTTQYIFNNLLFQRDVNLFALSLVQTWNTRLAQIAQSHAESCRWAPNLAASQLAAAEFPNGVGENTAFSFGSRSRNSNFVLLSQFVHEWFAESAFYNFTNNSCVAEERCDHYLQVRRSCNRPLTESVSSKSFSGGAPPPLQTLWRHSNRRKGLSHIHVAISLHRVLPRLSTMSMAVYGQRTCDNFLLTLSCNGVCHSAISLAIHCSLYWDNVLDCNSRVLASCISFRAVIKSFWSHGRYPCSCML